MLPLSGWFLASVFWRDSPSLWSEEHWHYMLGWHCFSRESSVWSITARAQGEQLGNLQPERREKNRLWSGQVGRWDSPHKGWLRRSFPWAEAQLPGQELFLAGALSSALCLCWKFSLQRAWIDLSFLTGSCTSPECP